MIRWLLLVAALLTAPLAARPFTAMAIMGNAGAARRSASSSAAAATPALQLSARQPAMS